MQKHLKRIDLKLSLIIISTWLSLALLIALIRYLGVELEMPYYFPISIFSFSFNLDGLLFFFPFIFILYNSINKIDKLNFTQVYLFSFFLILLGNLIQGNSFSGLTEPFLHSKIEYYNDALNITNWKVWLSEFNITQENLLDHSKTHPPFAVILNYLLIKITNNNIYLISLLFTLLFSFSFILINLIFIELNINKIKRNYLLILFSIIPSINIYGMATLDSIVLTCMLVSLLSFLKILNNKFNITNLALLIIGILFSNLLNFGSLFLVGTLGLYSLILIKQDLNYKPLLLLTLSLILSILVLYLLNVLFNYNHLTAFKTASSLENPDGFRGLIEPLNYIFTRIEGVSEILLFLGIPTLAVLLKNKNFKTINHYGLTYSAFIILIVMLLSGAYRTGETARAAIFIYPFILILISRIDIEDVKSIIILTGLQTALMQLVGFYIW